ncbi:MAG: carbohydrate-binding family 9-like protein [Lentisphaeria bacterium]
MRDLKTLLLMLGLGLLLPGCCTPPPRPPPPDPRTLVVVRAQEPIVIDGGLAEPSWERAVPHYLNYYDGTSDVRMREVKTCVRLLWDDRFLYVAFSCRDQEVFGYLTEPDAPVYWEDCVELVIAPEKITDYYEFTVNARGTLYDAVNHFDAVNRLRSDPAYRGGIRVAVRIDGTLNDAADEDGGWSVEMAIPWSGIKIRRPVPGAQFHGNFLRFDYPRAPGETGFQRRRMDNPASPAYRFLSLWPTYVKQWPHTPETFGTIQLR